MATATFERQAELLETIHACARELRELAGEALEIIVRPSPGSPSLDELDTGGERGRVVGITEPARPGGDPRDKRVIARENRRRLMAAFEANPAQWLAPRDLPALSGLRYTQLAGPLKWLVDHGHLEHNGEARTKARYRFTGSPLPGGASQNGHQLSARVRKNLERAEQEPAEPPRDPDNLLERVRRACAEDASTITELALRLDLPRRDIASCIEQLLDQDRIVKCGKRQLTGHAVYGADDE